MASDLISPVSTHGVEKTARSLGDNIQQGRSSSAISANTDLPKPLDSHNLEFINFPDCPADLESGLYEKEVARCPHVCDRCHQTYQPFHGAKQAIAEPVVVRSKRWHRNIRSQFWRFRYLFLLGVSLSSVIIGLAVWFTTRPPVGVETGAPSVALDRGDLSQDIDLWFQHDSGDIRHIFFNGDVWTGGTAADSVLSPYAPRPRKQTALMAVSYNTTYETTVRVFYIDDNNILQESIKSSESLGWTPGTLGLGQIEASPSPNTGLTVCKNMVWANDTFSLVLIYGGADGKNHMLTHSVFDTSWQYNHTFADSDATSGCECTVRGASRTDVWMFNTAHDLVQHSFEYNLSSTSSTYPPGAWTSSVAYSGNIRNPTSISGIKWRHDNSTFLHFQNSTGYVQEAVVDTNAPAPVRAQSPNPVGDRPAVPGAKLASLDLVTDPGGDWTQGEDSKVFAAFVGSERQITELSRNFNDNPVWTEVASPEIGT